MSEAGRRGGDAKAMGRLLKKRWILKVVEGAELRCDMGSNASKLKSREPKTEVIECHSVCDIMDHEPGISIPSFGACRVLGGPCVPDTPTPWISPTSVTGPRGSPVLLMTALLPCGVGGIIGVTDPGQSTVYLVALASPAELLQQALAVYPEVFAAVGRFPSNEQGLDSFLDATSIGGNDDTAWNKTNYNCQGFADALAQSLRESGVAQDARLIHFMAYRERQFWFDDQTVNHAVTEIKTADGMRYLVDGQTQKRSPGYQLDADGDIPEHIRDGWLLDLSNDSNSYNGNADYVEFGGPRAVGETWTPAMSVTTQSDGLNLDRDVRDSLDWETEWDPQPGSHSE